jgi:hypothetical protein
MISNATSLFTASGGESGIGTAKELRKESHAGVRREL